MLNKWIWISIIVVQYRNNVELDKTQIVPYIDFGLIKIRVLASKGYPWDTLSIIYENFEELRKDWRQLNG